MSELAAFQQAFGEALLAEESTGFLASTPGFAVYRNNCARGAVEALRAAYPTVDALIGEEAFTQTALDFRAGGPPRSPVLSDYGADFAEFLALQPWTGELPYLADVARLDRMWLECFLSPCPATRVAWLATPAMTIWQAHRQAGGFESLEPEWVEEGARFTSFGGSIDAEKIDRATYLQLAASPPGAAGRPNSIPERILAMATIAETPSRGPGLLSRVATIAAQALPMSLLLLVQRLGIAAVFFQSGRTKVEGWFTVPETTIELFRSEYALPLVPPDVAAYAATGAEHLFPILLVLGLMTRLSAAALLGMTLVIQLFVYPDAWPTHLSWAGLMLPLIALGGRRLSLDRLFRIP